MHRFERCTVRPGQRGLVARAVRLVLERHPAVAGLRQRPHHARVEVARLDRLRGEPCALGLLVARARSPRRRDRAARARASGSKRLQSPSASTRCMNRSGIQLARFRLCVRLRLVAGVVAQLEELLDVGVPRLEVDAAGALALAALVHRRRPRRRASSATARCRWSARSCSRSASRASARGGRRGRCRPRTSRAARRRCTSGRCSPGDRRASRAGSSSRAARAACPR